MTGSGENGAVAAEADGATVENGIARAVYEIDSSFNVASLRVVPVFVGPCLPRVLIAFQLAVEKAEPVGIGA